MILKNRLFVRKEPSRDAKSIYIFCEGVKREFQYFQYFKEIDSRVNIEVYPLNSSDDNSPTGLFQKAKDNLIVSEENPTPKYELISGDEVWFVIDTDEWGGKIDALRESCSQLQNWMIAQSNPCFEVWLAFHFVAKLPKISGRRIAKKWKDYVATKIVKGGYDSRKHPILLRTAIKNATKNYAEDDDGPSPGSSQVFLLGRSIYQLMKDKLDKAHALMLINK